MKNIIVGLSTLIIFISAGYVATVGGAFQGGEAGNIIEDIKTFKENKIAKSENKEDDKLRALKEKAGNISSFKVSKNYRSKCASCHGVNGQGILGPKLFDKSAKYIYAALIEYKSGRKENAVMKGLLMNIEIDELKELADEIGAFKDKAK